MERWEGFEPSICPLGMGCVTLSKILALRGSFGSYKMGLPWQSGG